MTAAQLQVAEQPARANALVSAPDAAVILAGGQGRRLGGRDKPALLVGGRTLLDRALDAVSGVPVVVVGPPRALPAGVFRVAEDPPGGGPAAAVAAGLRRVAGAARRGDRRRAGRGSAGDRCVDRRQVVRRAERVAGNTASTTRRARWSRAAGPERPPAVPDRGLAPRPRWRRRSRVARTGTTLAAARNARPDRRHRGPRIGPRVRGHRHAGRPASLAALTSGQIQGVSHAIFIGQPARPADPDWQHGHRPVLSELRRGNDACPAAVTMVGTVTTTGPVSAGVRCESTANMTSANMTCRRM